MTEEELAFLALMQESLMSFAARCFSELNPTQSLSCAPYLEVMVAKLTATLLGIGSKRLLISLPPRSLKSTIVSVAAVAWLLGRDPSKQIICASYGQDLADKFARDTRTIMSSSFYRNAFPGTVLSTRQTVYDFATTKQGFRMATSVGGVLTGRGGDVLLIDDPQKPEEALSETGRARANNWYDNTLVSRLNNKKDGIIIIVMQRLHQDDLAGHVLESGEGWEILSFPAIAIEDETYQFEDLRGPQSYRRRIGEVLDPERDSVESYQTIRESIGEYNFQSQYQQTPASREGGVIKREWLKYYAAKDQPRNFWFFLQSWDTACKGAATNDFSVCTTWAVSSNNDFYLLDVYRKRPTFPELKRAATDLSQKYGDALVLIEDKGSGISLIQELQAEFICSVQAYKPTPGSDKYMRLAAQSIKFESSRVYLPSDAPWLDDYVREITGFPGCKHDDQVDSTSQALEYLGNMAPPGPFRSFGWGVRGYEY
jgi:predicted phage terminase large subunit-like protein